MTLFPKIRSRRKVKKVSQHWENIGGMYKLFKDGRMVHFETPKGNAWYRAQTLAMAERQDWICGLLEHGHCALPSHRMYRETGMLGSVTFEHANKRGAGKQNDNINADGNCAVHCLCNSVLGSRRI